MGKLVDFVVDKAKNVLGGAADIISAPFQIVGDIIGGDVGKFIKSAGNLASNTIKAVGNSILDSVYYISQGDFKAALDSAMNLIPAVLVVAAVIIAGVSGQWWIIPELVYIGSVIMLDSAYNKGQLLHSTVELAGGLEKQIFHSTYIRDNAYIIEASLQVISSMYVSSVGMYGVLQGSGFLKSLSESQLIYLKWANNIHGAYQAYTAVNSIIMSADYYKQKLSDYQEALAKWTMDFYKQKEAFFTLFSSTDVYRYLPGGDMYNRTAPGGDMFDRLDVHEPYKYMLGYLPSENEYTNTALNPDYYYEKMAGNQFYQGGV